MCAVAWGTNLFKRLVEVHAPGNHRPSISFMAEENAFLVSQPPFCTKSANHGNATILVSQPLNQI